MILKEIKDIFIKRSPEELILIARYYLKEMFEAEENIVKRCGYLMRSKPIENKQFKFGDYLFQGPDFNYKKLNVLRLGVKVGEVSKDVIKFDYHYAHYLSSFENEVELDKELTYKYLNGDTLNLPCKKGFVLLKYQGKSLDIGKSDGSRIKNRIPSRIRNLNKVNF